VITVTSETRVVRPASRVSANEGVVLGMLACRPGSGYDLIRRISGSVGYFWTPARSHVYSLLPRLLALGWVTRRTVAQATAPDKHVYEITSAGHDALEAWLSSPDLSEGPSRNPFLVKVFFGGVLERAEIVAHIQTRRDAIAAELEELEAIEAQIDRDASPFGWLALRYGLEQDRAILRWADEALSVLGPAA
jgi:PadR family transcriptional regulator AphA